MTEVFLAYTFDISDEDVQPSLFVATGNQQPKCVLLTDLDFDGSNLIVFNAPPLIDYFRRSNFRLPERIIDLFQVFKILRLKPRKFHWLSDKQLLGVFAKELLGDKIDCSELLATLGKCNSESDPLVIPQPIKNYLNELRVLFKILIQQLKDKEEFERFFNIEVPISQILYRRQFLGVNISSSVLTAKIDTLNNELDKLKKTLRLEYGIIDHTDVHDIRKTLSAYDFPYLSKMVHRVRDKAFWNFVKAGSENNDLLKTLYSVYRYSFDRKSLLKISPNERDIIFPIYDCCGTVTSRIQVRYPHIQHMKRSSRDIIVAKSGYSLIYADYSQFEPGILASLADDDHLIELYNTNDLYTSLSINLFENDQMRQLCKTIFLSFMYGMSSFGLTRIIQDFFGNEKNNKKVELDLFFKRFKKLMPYKESLQNHAIAEQRIGSLMGNFRYYRQKEVGKQLPNKVKRWVLSQRVQGTASLILKTAILDVCNDEEIEFLIPMHDAALFQVPIEKQEDKIIEIKSKFERALQNYCPKLNPKVSFKKFTE